MNTIVLVGCGKRKEEKRQPSWRLYKKPYFEAKMTVAMLLGDPFIYSAKHGLIPPTERVDPYNKSMNNISASERREVARLVASEIPAHYGRVVILAGRNYAEPLLGCIQDRETSNVPDCEVYDPLDAFGGNGSQKSWCIKAAEELIGGASFEEVMP